MKLQEITYFLYMSMSIILFFFVVYFLTKFIAKTNKKLLMGKTIKIKEKVIMGNNKSLSIVEVGGKHYFLAITKDDIKLIDTREDLNLEENETLQFDDILIKKIKTKLKRGSKKV